MPARRLSVPLIVAVALTLAIPGAAARTSGPVTRAWPVSVAAPAQFDFALAELSFRGAAGRVTLSGAPGLYYVAAAVVRRPRSGGARALVLVVNERPRGSLAPDRSSIALRVSTALRFGAPRVHQRNNIFTTPVGAGARPLCGLGSRHGAGDLRGAVGAGRRLAGLTAAAAIAQAYAVACGLPANPAFAAAVRGPCAAGLVAGCCPPNALCATPTPVAPPPAPTPTPMPPACPPPCPPPCVVGYVRCPLGAVRAQRALGCPPPVKIALAC